MRILGIALLLLGIFGLVYGGIDYNRQRTVLDLGPIKATATEHKQLPISPILGVLAIVGGALLLITAGRRSA